MIILDTNVVSELMKASPNPTLTTWFDAQIATEIWITAITVYETRFGLQRMALGRRRAFMESQFEALVRDDLMGRVATVDRAAGDVAAMLAAKREAMGLNIDMGDTLIAGVAVARRATIATRNRKYFRALDVPVIDPWAGCQT